MINIRLKQNMVNCVFERVELYLYGRTISYFEDRINRQIRNVPIHRKALRDVVFKDGWVT